MKIEKDNQIGFTLIEIIIVVGLLVFVAYIILSTNFSSYRSYSFRDERDTLINNLQRMRSLAMNNICYGTCTSGTSHSVHFETSEYILYQGEDWDSHDSEADEIVKINPVMQISGPTDIVFTPLSGDVTVTPSGSYDITLTDNMSHSSVITLNKVGQIKWTN